MQSYGLPEKQGLYSPAFEHDACGVGLICNLKGEKSHSIIHKGLEILVNLTHRGATGCDPLTGDGAGILFQMPHAFFMDCCQDSGIKLPGEHEYGAGLVFLPRDKDERDWCMDKLERAVAGQGQQLLGWRKVPVENDTIGRTAREVEPDIRQIFIGRGRNVKDDIDFERQLYIIRKISENAVRNSTLAEKKYFHIPSLSCRTIVYKGMLLAEQVESFYPDMANENMQSGLAIVHQRYSTNTFPTWDLAQPFRFMCHNGEINTVRGNTNWMNARQSLFRSEIFGKDIEKLFPIATPGASDSAVLDNAVELMYHTGRSLPHVMMMLIPEAWQNSMTMPDNKKAFYEYHSCLMEPWDGPASIPFTDGQCIGAVLDRNGLRPSRYTVTKDGLVIMGSETGVLPVEPENVKEKGRLKPGRMFLVDTEKGRIIDDAEIKDEIASRKPYRAWLNKNLVGLDALPAPEKKAQSRDSLPLLTRQKMFGFTNEDYKFVIKGMIENGIEPTSSMGDDTPLAVLSEKPQLLFNYFRHLFAQVTNPPLDAIREEVVTSLKTNIGPEQDLFEETELHCHQTRLDSPILTHEEFAKLSALDSGSLKAVTLPMLFNPKAGNDSMEKAFAALCADADKAVDSGASVLILSDRGADGDNAPMPSLIAAAGVHHHLIGNGKRTRCGIVVETGEVREIHHMAVLFGYGTGAVYPYLAYETIEDMVKSGYTTGVESVDKAIYNYIKAAKKGVLKIMSKMGISTLHSYRGAQIFEAVGLASSLVDKYFTGTASRIEGVDAATVQEETLRRFGAAFPEKDCTEHGELGRGGVYQWRRNGEYHRFNPFTISTLQRAARENSAELYEQFAKLANDPQDGCGLLRNLLDFKAGNSVPLDEVEPASEILKRFKTGAMSYGSLSREAHEALAIAMNRIKGKSNTGEGGEDEDRFTPDANGDLRRSAIKQVASGRFGVTGNYLINADEIQIKMAQGAKPGEGGQLPGQKVYPWIAKTRHSTPFVQLISPPPHHDIYSIEDLAQLIYDLKNANRRARISVKLVSEVGVGTVAAGVSKGKADLVLISAHDGGTGASPSASIMHAGLPWELGLAETHQTLVLNDLRSRIVVECDGKMMTGRDITIACLLGAEEFGFATAPLVVLGCIMMRKCHLNTCPVGITTQDPELRKNFTGDPAHLVNYFIFVAEEMRRIMASLGFRTVNEMVGRSDMLEARKDIKHWKASKLDFSSVLYRPKVPEHIGTYCSQKQDHPINDVLDIKLLEQAADAIESGKKTEIDVYLRNIDRTVGTILSSEISRKYGSAGLPEDTITLRATGSAGQSFCAFGAKGLTVDVRGDANDYFGKGLSGARVSIRPAEGSSFTPETNVIIGNVALYGATSGEVFVRGLAGERFCVRNSGARAVVEGIGDHGCEYMTGGRVLVIGPTGINFAAGMSGGIAYVLDETGDFKTVRCNPEMVDLETVTDNADIGEIKDMLESHVRCTDSAVARNILDNFDAFLPKFVKVFPVDYKRALRQMAEAKV